MNQTSTTTRPVRRVQGRADDTSVGPVRRWVIAHDQSWLFTIGYIALAVGLSVWVSIFWLLVVVAVHFAFEWIKQGWLGHRGFARRVSWALWDMKLDVALVIWAFALLAYTQVEFGIAGLSGAGRMSIMGLRLGPMMQSVRGLLPLPWQQTIMAGRITATRNVDHYYSIPAHDAEAAGPDFPWQQKWSWWDHSTVWFTLMNVAAVLIAPWLTDQTFGEMFAALAEALHPWEQAGRMED
ncbi:hypothetical protein ACERK3_15250 [Phycisphaerales bacterium AB-hyl4]|uniref:Uncharacterized protein n=1 Tax=Natronomicrosphaera hydrolytica TaxID=3242702 RepID=A0ABV4U7R3_9BACT